MKIMKATVLALALGSANAYATAPFEIDLKRAEFTSADGGSYSVALSGAQAAIVVSEKGVRPCEVRISLLAPGALSMDTSGVLEDRVSGGESNGERIVLLQFSVIRFSEDSSGKYPVDRYEVRFTGPDRSCELSVFDESGSSVQERKCISTFK